MHNMVCCKHNALMSEDTLTEAWLQHVTNTRGCDYTYNSRESSSGTTTRTNVSNSSKWMTVDGTVTVSNIIEDSEWTTAEYQTKEDDECDVRVRVISGCDGHVNKLVVT